MDQTMMEKSAGKSVVLGATGNIGTELVRCLLQNGEMTVAFARSEQKLNELKRRLEEEKLPIDLLQTIKGDIFNQEELVKACEGADTIYQSANVPYSEWKNLLVPLAQNVVKAASSVGARIVAVDNIYGYGRRQQVLVDETHPKNPHTRKGKIRLAMEQVWMEANQSGTKVAIFKLPDFYGPDAPNTLLHYTLSAIAAGKSAMYIGDQSIAREFIYMPDAAKALVKAAAYPEAYGQAWNVPGAGSIKGSDLMSFAAEAVSYGKRVGTIGRFMMAFAGLFNRQYREYLEMMYLLEEPLILNGSAYESVFGEIPKTTYKEGIAVTIRALKNQLEQ